MVHVLTRRRSWGGAHSPTTTADLPLRRGQRLRRGAALPSSAVARDFHGACFLLMNAIAVRTRVEKAVEKWLRSATCGALAGGSSVLPAVTVCEKNPAPDGCAGSPSCHSPPPPPAMAAAAAASAATFGCPMAEIAGTGVERRMARWSGGGRERRREEELRSELA